MKNEKNSKASSLAEAEMNARKRDLEVEKEKFKEDHRGVDQEELTVAMETLSRATGKEMFIGTKRSVKSRVKFAQMIQENLQYLYENKYLSGREKIFLMEIIPYIAFSSNCIVINISAKNSVPANITEIAKLIYSDRSNTSKVINSLKEKGILAKSESGVEGSNAKAYAIFLNPHIIYAGDRDKVNDTLKVMFSKAMKMPILKDLPNRLF